MLAYVSAWYYKITIAPIKKIFFNPRFAIFLQVIGIYGYTIFAIQQERFLDDFDMPEEIDRTKKD